MVDSKPTSLPIAFSIQLSPILANLLHLQPTTTTTTTTRRRRRRRIVAY
jgi:hypothetical protein